jgi:hypothetical protein
MSKSRFFLRDIRLRAGTMAFASFGLASVAPSGLRGLFPFLFSPPGLGIVAIALLMLGFSVEETGTVRRIRIGVGFRIVAFVLVLLSAAWAVALGALSSSLAVFGFCLFGVGAAGATFGFRHDLRVFADVRHGQPLRLEKITAQTVLLRARDRDVSIPTSLIRGVAVAKDLDGRGVLVLVHGRDKVVGDVASLPWLASTLEGDTFILTEHEAGLDAEVLAARLLEASTAAQESGYR